MRINWPNPFRSSGRAGYVARRRMVALCVAFGIALLSGVVGFGNPFEEVFRSMRGSINAHPASGQIVAVGIDDKTIKNIDRWPLPRGYYAQLINQLHKDGAKRVFLDFIFDAPSDQRDDQLFLDAINHWPAHVYLAAQTLYDPFKKQIAYSLPLERFAAHSHVVSISIWYSFRNSITRLPFALNLKGTRFPSLSAGLASINSGPIGQGYLIDPAIRTSTIPYISAYDMMKHSFKPETVSGKDIVIGLASAPIGDVYFYPGQGAKPGMYFHIAGAETLREGGSRYLGWFAPFLLAALLSIVGLSCARFRAPAFLGTVFLAFIIVPIFLDRERIFIDIMPSLLLTGMLGATTGWQETKRFYRERAATNAVSGLPNLTALREAGSLCPHPLIAARVLNYADIVSTLPPEMEGVLIHQIATRLTLGHPALRLHQGDEGIFAWVAEAGNAGSIGDHLNALHTIFRAPVAVGTNLFDLALTFGVDEDVSRPVVARLGSALVAADEAAAAGAKWKIYDPAKLKEATWRLSLLSQLDAAIDDGELWVAYQPKFDLASRSIIGAEALVRWTHRDKGPISPEEFVRAAEQSNRIEKLTMHVLDRAIESAAAINAQGIPFEIAVNISAKLIDDQALVASIAALLAKHGLDSRRLTLEVTETAAMASSEASLETLSRLRTLGLQLAIDDYGTGLSTLEYLRKIPANEIKIDKSFIQAMEGSHGDRLLVQSTIELAHSLGRRIVAEGVEREETLDLLTAMECDLVQGYLIGKPMTLRALCERLAAERGLEAA